MVKTNLHEDVRQRIFGWTNGVFCNISIKESIADCNCIYTLAAVYKLEGGQTIKMFRALYNFTRSKYFIDNPDQEPELFQCLDCSDELHGVILCTVYKPKPYLVRDQKTIEIQFDKNHTKHAKMFRVNSDLIEIIESVIKESTGKNIVKTKVVNKTLMRYDF
jgi:hypothetical protein